MKNVAAGANPMVIKKGIKKAVDTAVEAIVGNLQARRRHRTISPESAPYLPQRRSYRQADRRGYGEGYVRTALSPLRSPRPLRPTARSLKACSLTAAIISPYMATDTDKMEAVLDDALILITDKKISNIQEILPLLEQIVQGRQESSLIIAEDVEGEALATTHRSTSCAAPSPALRQGSRLRRQT